MDSRHRITFRLEDARSSSPTASYDLEDASISSSASSLPPPPPPAAASSKSKDLSQAKKPVAALPRHQGDDNDDDEEREGMLPRLVCKCLIPTLFLLTIAALAWFVQHVASNNKSYPSPWTWPDSGKLTVGAYYYPWYGDDFHGSGYMRNQLSPPQYPALGEYDDTDPDVIYQHFVWSSQANIRLWVTSWWGEGSRSDTTIKDHILKHPSLEKHQIALFYETTGRIKKREDYSTERVIPDMEYIARNYFSHPNYYRIQGRPVLFIYLTRKLEELGILNSVLQQMRQTALKEGHDVYLVGDHVFHHAPEEDDIQPPLDLLDAITNYDVYGSMFRPTPAATEQVVQQHYERGKDWSLIAAAQNCAFIPSAGPGYNDRGVRPEKQHGPLSRKLEGSDEPGSLFRSALQNGRTLTDPSTNYLFMINSFNEWHEDTQIEPVRLQTEGSATIKTTTAFPKNLTDGVEYEEYGDLYIDILRNETTRP